MLAASKNYDLIVIGGGINGSAIAKLASSYPLKVLLLEKGDYASGASSKTSKLAHGGLRYLEQGAFTLIQHSLNERNNLIKKSPRLVKPLKFFYPVYQDNKWPLFMLKAGFHLYDFLSSKSELPKAKFLSRNEVEASYPFLKKENLRGGFIYYDALMDDARLVIEKIMDFRESGGVALNYTSVDEIIKTSKRAIGVKYKSLLYGLQGEVFGEFIINATGADANKIAEAELVKPSKGAHLVLNRHFSDSALLFHAPQDGRVIFLIPWKGKTLLGTTDSAATHDTQDFMVLRSDEKYLLEAANHGLQGEQITSSDIISKFAGLRPLLASQKKSYNASRDHKIIETYPSLFSVVGGKYTTHQLVAKEVVSQILKRRGLNGTVTLKDEPQVNSTDRLEQTYGKRAEAVRKKIALVGDEKITGTPYYKAEVYYCIENEQAMTLSDWFFRRTSIGYTTKISQEILEETLKIFKDTLHWSEERIQEEKECTIFF